MAAVRPAGPEPRMRTLVWKFAITVSVGYARVRGGQRPKERTGLTYGRHVPTATHGGFLCAPGIRRRGAARGCRGYPPGAPAETMSWIHQNCDDCCCPPNQGFVIIFRDR